MDLDDQLQRYFATRDPEQISPGALSAGLDRMAVDLGMEEDAGRRFALWSLMLMLGRAPDIDSTFKSADERHAARNMVAMMHGDPEN
ncbi:hypothetical protein [Croceicoccus sp. YJ47]|uniref:hypothetical protein n=1 Tax=Croceicoccus sp. YJ47 TaxID=2798724 RepID=UPI001923DB2F|nr:hypothetical protein [Croceicoccus sp. YJ47]QQN74667.1 hypothetical protein JD971_02675 [Croceicoccus sp. YJ47]